jgi:hypothetical protein
VIEVRPARDDGELSAALALRHEVFVVEQRVPLEDEVDGRDGRALHLVAVEDGAVVATCRLLPDGTTIKLGRMTTPASAERSAWPWAPGQTRSGSTSARATAPTAAASWTPASSTS